MILAAEGDWLSRLTGVSPEALDAWIPGILLTGMVLSSLYLLVMFATRWGERNPAAKTMIFSIMAHALLLLAWEFFVPAKPAWRQSDVDEPPPAREILVKSDERIDLRQSGNTPWEKTPDPVEAELERQERDPFEPLPLETPDRATEAPEEPSPIAMVDVPSIPNEPIATPKIQQQGVERPLAEAAIPLNTPLPQPVDRPQEQPDAEAVVRESVPQRDRIEATITRQSAPGAVERVEREINTNREVAALPLPVRPESDLQRAPTASDTLINRAAPAPIVMPEEVPGAAAKESAQGSSVGRVLPFAPTRGGTRETDPRDGGAVERLRPDVTPGGPDAADVDRLAMTEGTRSPISIRSSVPNIIRPSGENVRRPSETAVPTIYEARDEERRKELARRYGGSEETERAVAQALKWLADHQHPDGYWDADALGAGQANDKDLQDAGRDADTGVTALALLAFLGSGQTHETGDYTATVERGLRWLLSQQTADGFLGGAATQYERMYCHGMATYALAEAYGMQQDRAATLSLRRPLEAAVGYLVSVQNSDGGWRYDHEKFPVSDMSMFGWQVLALKRAEAAGIAIPKAVEDKMVKFLIDRSLGESKGLAAYYPGMQPTPTMTAEALYCKQRFGIRRDNPGSIEAVAYLLQNRPRIAESNFYYWYYGALAMFEHGAMTDPGAEETEDAATIRRRQQWEAWNESMTDALLATQALTGEDAGSWPPRDRWGPHGGRVYSTALAAMCLEVYYRGVSELENVASRRGGAGSAQSP